MAFARRLFYRRSIRARRAMGIGKSMSPRRGFADADTSWLLPLEFERGFAAFDINFEFGRWHHPAAQPDSRIATPY